MKPYLNFMRYLDKPNQERGKNRKIVKMVNESPNITKIAWKTKT